MRANLRAGVDAASVRGSCSPSPNVPEYGCAMSLLEAVVWYYGGVSLCTLVAYGWDKAAAKRPGATRVRERTLHLWALAGGFAGALLGQFVLRHKTRHGAFIAVTLLAAAAHVTAWLWWWCSDR